MPEVRRRPSAFARVSADLKKRQGDIQKLMNERLARNRQRGTFGEESYRRRGMLENERGLREKQLLEERMMFEDPEVEYAIERVAQRRELAKNAQEVENFRRTNRLLIEEIERMLREGMGTNRGMSKVFSKNVSVMIALTLQKQLGSKLMQLRSNPSALRQMVGKINYNVMLNLQGVGARQMIALQRSGQMQEVVAQAAEEVIEESQGE